MGMSDEVRCTYHLGLPWAQDLVFQTKDTPAQQLDRYQVRQDGTLWHENYDVRWKETAESPLGFWMHRENPRWVSIPLNGELYMYAKDNCGRTCYVRFWFRDGVVTDMVIETHGDGEEKPP